MIQRHRALFPKRDASQGEIELPSPPHPRQEGPGRRNAHGHERRPSAGQQAGRRHRPRSGAGTILISPIHPDHIFRHEHGPGVHSSRGVRFRHADAVARRPLPTAEPRAKRKERWHRRTHALPAIRADARMRVNAWSKTGDLKKRASSAILWQYDESGRPADLPREKASRGRRWFRRSFRRSGRGCEPLGA